jgi:hypothetical protein
MSRRFEAILGGGNIRNNHLPLGDLRAYLPPSVIGGSNKSSPGEVHVTILIGDEAFPTDVPSDKPTMFRNREMARYFFERSDSEEGDTIVYEEVGPLTFRVNAGVPAKIGPRERVRKWVEIDTRPEQQKFRAGIVARDGLRCAITGCEEPSVLDAAHIQQRAKEGSDDPANGMILRADIHRLFDAGLLQINPRSRTVIVDPRVHYEAYRALEDDSVQTSADLSVLELADE